MEKDFLGIKYEQFAIPNVLCVGYLLCLYNRLIRYNDRNRNERKMLGPSNSSDLFSLFA